MSFELISENFQIRISNWPFSRRVSQDLILSTRRASRIAFRVSIQVQHISELGYLNSYPNSWRGSAKASQWTSTEALFWVFSETSFSRISRLEREPKIANFFAELFYSLLLSFTLFILLSTLFTRLRKNLRNARGVESRGELAKSADSDHPIRITRLRSPNSPNSKYFESPDSPNSQNSDHKKHLHETARINYLPMAPENRFAAFAKAPKNFSLSSLFKVVYKDETSSAPTSVPLSAD